MGKRKRTEEGTENNEEKLPVGESKSPPINQPTNKTLIRLSKHIRFIPKPTSKPYNHTNLLGDPILACPVLNH